MMPRLQLQRFPEMLPRLDVVAEKSKGHTEVVVGVGIVRREEEMVRALDAIEKLWARARRAGVPGNREYNPGWHTAMDLTNLLTVSEAITRASIERKESRGAQFREDFPQKSDALGKVNVVIRRGADGRMQVIRTPLPEMRADLRQVVDEMK